MANATIQISRREKVSNTYFKVCSVDDQGRIGSIIVYGLAYTRYYFEHWSSSPRVMARQGYYPLVFETLEQALGFVRSLLMTEGYVFEVEVDGDISLPPKGYLGWLDDGDIFPSHTPWPEGTVMARRVRLKTTVSI